MLCKYLLKSVLEHSETSLIWWPYLHADCSFPIDCLLPESMLLSLKIKHRVVEVINITVFYTNKEEKKVTKNEGNKMRKYNQKKKLA